MTQTTQTAGHLKPEELNALVDGELSHTEVESIQKHLEGCHGCTLRVLSATQLKAATARAGGRFAPPSDAMARLAAQLRTSTPKPAGRKVQIRPASFVFIGAWSAIAAAILVSVSVAIWQHVHDDDALTAELVDQHLSMLSSGATMQVVSSDRHTVKPWFQGRLPFSFNLPEPEALPPDTTLNGADLVYVEGQPVALLIFSIGKHEVSVFVTQRASFAGMPQSTRSGFAVRSVTAAQLRLTAVSDVEPVKLDALVADLAKVQ
jgi:anti-sigma factor RsiW